MKYVYVVTSKEYLKPEQYVAVKATMEEAEGVIRAEYKDAAQTIFSGNPMKFIIRDEYGNPDKMMLIHEEAI